jgi:gliding motility-associated-like protein
VEVAESSVIFGWESIPGAIGYELDDGTVLAANELNYTVNGLSPEESATLSVVALSASACANSLPSTVQSCTTLPDLSCDFSVSLGPDLSISIGDSLQLSLVSNALVDSISWQNLPGLSCLNCPEPIAKPAETTTYSVTITDENGCIASDELTVIVDETRKIYIPNVFSPNGDGINDYFEIQGGPDLRIIRSLNIYDRWGAQLFNTTDQPVSSPSARWGGERLGQPVEAGIYIYSAMVQFADGHVEQIAGEIMVMR